MHSIILILLFQNIPIYERMLATWKAISPYVNFKKTLTQTVGFKANYSKHTHTHSHSLKKINLKLLPSTGSHEALWVGIKKHNPPKNKIRVDT